MADWRFATSPTVPAAVAANPREVALERVRLGDDDGGHVPPGCVHAPEFRGGRGSITSFRSESSTSATRTIVFNSMFWT